VVVVTRPDPALLLGAIPKHRVTEFFLPPTVIYRLLDIPDWEIFAWLVGQEAVPEKHKGPVLDQLIGFRYAPRGG
jgi:hypothetical protein